MLSEVLPLSMKRIFTAVLLIAIVVALIFYGQIWMLTLACALVAELAAYEYLVLAKGHGNSIPVWWMAAGIALLFLATFYRPTDMALPVLSALALILLVWSAFRDPLDRVLSESATGLFGLVYIGYPLTLLPMIWNRDDGRALLLFLMVCVWAGDTVALYVGKSMGKHKLTRLSPNKTWEGSIGSVVGSVIFGMLVVYAGEALTARGNTVLHMAQPVWQSVLLAVLINVAAQIGDLVESAIKRGAGVKDSGSMLPGHGGILDRIDALLMAAPVLWLALLVRDAVSMGRFQ
jgi:phosphatidate cytidylyltransferase